MTEYTAEQKNKIAEKVLMYLDGWKSVESFDEEEPPQEENSSEESEIDIDELYSDETSDEEAKKYFDHVNKKIVLSFLLNHYESTLKQALNITRQKKVESIESLDQEDQDMFYQAVYKLTASNLWKLYNTRAKSDGTEDDWKDSYSGVLYIQAMNELKPYKIGFNIAVAYIPDE